MRILIFTFGTRGDVQPYIALGKALIDRGHAVTLSTGQGFEEMIEAHGLAAAPLSIDIRKLVQTPEMQDALQSFSGKVRAWRSFRGQFRRQFDDMWTVARQVRPDLLISHPKGFAAHEIAEKLQIISLPTSLQPGFVPTSAFPQFLVPFASLGAFGNRLSHRAFDRLSAWGQAKAMGDWRQAVLGLRSARPHRFVDGHHPDGRAVPHLHGYSRHLVPKPDDWGEREHITGDWHLEQQSGWIPPADLARFLDAGPPPVYVGFGSMPEKDAAGLARIVSGALRLSGQRGIVASGWGGMEADRSDRGWGGMEADRSDRIHVLEAAPHDWLFPRCAAVVHHGGAGTTHEGLRRGRPTIICPFGVDQPFWGRRVHGLGAGPAPISRKRLTSARLAAAITEALQPDIVSRATQIGAAMRTERGAAAAAAIIETVL